MTDDISMGALSGSLSERAAAALHAGCDMVLHCSGRIEEMRELAEAVPVLAGAAANRASIALASRRPAGEIDVAATRNRLAGLLAGERPAGAPRARS